MNGQLLIDVNELSPRIGIPKDTLYQWVYLRRMPFLKGAAPCVSAVKSKAGRPPYGAAWPAHLCAAKPFSNGFWFWSGRNGRSHRYGLSPVTLMKTGKKLQIGDGV